MHDRWVVAVAVAAVVGARSGAPVPVWPAAGLVVAALTIRRPPVLLAGVALLAAGLSAAAWSGLEPPPAHELGARMVLVTDPERFAGAVRVVVRSPEGRLEAWARGAPARRLERRLAGEQVVLRGRVVPLTGGARERLAVRHVRARLEVEAVGGWSPGNAPNRAANRVRRLLERGARTLPPGERALFTGFVLGDDRAQSPVTINRYRAAGLSHLMAVSGQNVAFVLALCRPLLQRLGIRARYGATLAVIAWFVLLTRFEPSVVRAGGMAALAATTVVLARPQSALRLLGLAVTAVVLIDPLLAWSVGFWLSVSATAGLVLLSGPLTQRLPGPRPLAEGLGATLAAQIGVLPVSVVVFGGVPLVSVPANLLALPVAAPVLLWGLPAGLVAAFLPDSVAALIHLPTRVCLRWIDVVAHVAAAVPLGWLGLLPALGIAVPAGVVAVGRRIGIGRRTRLGRGTG